MKKHAFRHQPFLSGIWIGFTFAFLEYGESWLAGSSENWPVLYNLMHPYKDHLTWMGLFSAILLVFLRSIHSPLQLPRYSAIEGRPFPRFTKDYIWTSAITVIFISGWVIATVFAYFFTSTDHFEHRFIYEPGFYIWIGLAVGFLIFWFIAVRSDPHSLEGDISGSSLWALGAYSLSTIYISFFIEYSTYAQKDIVFLNLGGGVMLVPPVVMMMTFLSMLGRCGREFIAFFLRLNADTSQEIRFHELKQHFKDHPDIKTGYVVEREISEGRVDDLQGLYSFRENPLQFPLKGNHKIDDHFCHYGKRIHPVTLTPQYFHTGVDIISTIGEPVYPVAVGILRYSGFEKTGGFYVILEHPQYLLIHEDHCLPLILHSMYMHLEKIEANCIHSKLEKAFLQFFQFGGKKIFHPESKIGTVGASGAINGHSPHLHLQLFFADPGLKHHIIINPERALNIRVKRNKTATFLEKKDFQTYYLNNTKEMSFWSDLIERNL